MFGAIAAPLIGGIASAFGAHMQNQESRRASEAQMAFQERTLRHQYQWATEDMKAAGINPMLAYQQGGSGSAGGSTYQPQNIGAAGAAGYETGSRSSLQSEQARQARTAERLAAERQEYDLEALRSSTALQRAQEATQPYVQAREAAQASQASAQAHLANAQVQNVQAQTAILGEELQSAKAAAARARADEEFYESEEGTILRMIDRIGTSLNPMVQSSR